jgi:hypothetical protein
MAGVSHIESVRPIVVSILGDPFDDRRCLADIPHTERLLEAAGLGPQAGGQVGKADRIGAIKEALALFPKKALPSVWPALCLQPLWDRNARSSAA